jgi:HK97 gp10 family phage protein
MKMTVAVDGLIDLDQALQELTKGTARNVVKRALRAAANPIYQAMVSGAPTHIKDSVEVGDKLTARQAKQARREGNKAPITLHVGVSYRLGMKGRTAHLFEFGTAARMQGTTGRATGRIAARPFVRPAWDGNQDNALSILKDQMWAEILNANKRAERKAARAAAKLARGG